MHVTGLTVILVFACPSGWVYISGAAVIYSVVYVADRSIITTAIGPTGLHIANCFAFDSGPAISACELQVAGRSVVSAFVGPTTWVYVTGFVLINSVWPARSGLWRMVG